MTETNKGAHTPGPWSAGPQCEISGWVDISIGGYPRNPVASATPAGPGGAEERRDSETVANARLIAAAPELLEACQTFGEWLRREEGGFPAETRFNTPEGETKWREWFDENLRICALAQEQARAAIAKATGAPA